MENVGWPTRSDLWPSAIRMETPCCKGDFAFSEFTLSKMFNFGTSQTSFARNNSRTKLGVKFSTSWPAAWVC